MTSAPHVTTSTNPTAPQTLKEKPHMHLWKTRNNSPGAISLIQVVTVHPVQRRSKSLNQALEEDKIFTVHEVTMPNLYQIPLTRSNLVSQEALNAITNKVFYKEPSASWTWKAFIEESQTSPEHTYDTNIEHDFCAPLVHRS